ncbi:siderophore ABC transporter substrate-binding protein [Maritalea mediterranea]|uniref:Siderophore ABC transporter substrate-binding protein n=1 Tax=Maritalea mediterranea TaxID=2909667 RepID=A0ABS9EA36_9HYPH|nr:siderophore ABC transporter substrate-binding protein [Maritalea mediterranea]MCF4099745.1 siderophore ABC transporter substrate-binding protein [Maritalea mediterranea]
MLRSFLVAATLLATPAFAETVTVETYKGEAEVPANPAKIAVYDVSALDTLDALGIKPTGVLTPHYVSYLDDTVEGAEQVGSFFEPDFEALAALDVDLVVAGGRSSTHVDAFNKIAPTIDMTIWEDTVGQGLDRLAAYGKIFDKEARAIELADAFNAKLDQTKALLDGKGKALILMTNGPKVSAYGASGRFGWLHTNLDLDEAAKDVEQSTHGEAASFEFIKDTNPDILIVIDRLAAIGQDGESAKKTLDNPLVHETNAWKNGQVVYLSSAPLYIAGGGIQSMNIILDDIQATFKGE